MKDCYVNWKNRTVHKLNILHIKYKNWKFIKQKQRLLKYFKRWRRLQNHYKTTVQSLSHWADAMQTKYFNVWHNFTFIVAPKSRKVFCDRIRKYLALWRLASERSKQRKTLSIVIAQNREAFIAKMSWIKWLICFRYCKQLSQIEKFI